MSNPKITIFRYGHIYDDGGGMEQYVADLNGAIHAIQQTDTLQIQLTSREENVGLQTNDLQQGTFTRCSLFVGSSSHEAAISGLGARPKLASTLAKKILESPLGYSIAGKHLQRARGIPARSGEPQDLLPAVEKLYAQSPFDIICLHTAGSADAQVIIDFAKTKGISVVYIHHFANDRLSSLSMRSQMDTLEGVSGVSAVDVPGYLKKRFFNVSDGIDTDFFCRDNTVERGTPKVIFLPARITPTKGQAELIKAGGKLKAMGYSIRIHLAGRLDSDAYLKDLKELIAQENLQEELSFLGQLNQQQLRDAYQKADLLAFPTTHHEGHPRVLMETQAMKVPPIVHDIGGTSEGVVHGQTGFLVKPGDSEALVRHMKTLLDDDALRIRMGEAGRKRIEEHFSLKALAQRHLAFYQAAIERHRQTALPR